MKNDKIRQILIDTGGTFTDCLAVDSAGRVKRAKVLSNGSLRGIIVEILVPRRILIKGKWSAPSGFINGYKFRLLNREHDEIVVTDYDADKSIIEISRALPADVVPLSVFEIISPDEAPVLAAKLVTQTAAEQELPPISIRLATTRGTNALLERKGEAVALFITKGFGDLLEIGTQQRPDLFALNIVKPKPLYSKVIEVLERVEADGSVLQPLNLNGLEKPVAELLNRGISAAAIAFMHSYRNPVHEEKLAEFLRTRGFRTVSCSSASAPFIKILPRAQTAVVNAYLSPVINQYLQRVQKPIQNGKLHVLTSAGGLIQAGSFYPKDSLLSGPAGGVVGAAFAGKQSGYEKVITFDMGGTSTDVARFDGDFEYLFEHEVGDAHLVATALAIESVAAGGGSICG
ncbi:MAG TPA: hydantoinase/oxoprolinase family protein, partial [Bacteroidetes bacterium]|nr:hydantoinase/oxoprolinase family protein [Bacteroidota bacterium]